MRKLKQYTREIVSFSVAIVAFLSFFFYLSGILALLVSVLAAVLSYIGTSMLLAPAKQTGLNLSISDIASKELMDKTMDGGYSTLQQITKYGNQIKRPAIQEKITLICTSISKILNYLENNPTKIKSARRFFSYYLDATNNILAQYVEIANENVMSTDIKQTLFKVENSLDLIVTAYDKQFASLLEDKVFNLEADMKLLESTIKLEGN